MKTQLPYDKYTFALSVIGFIGSVAFYLGVLKEVSEKRTEKTTIEQLETHSAELEQQLKECKNH